MISEPRYPTRPIAQQRRFGEGFAGGAGSAQVLRRVFSNKLHLVACALAALWAWSDLLGTPALAVDYVLMALCVASIYQWNRLTDVAEDGLNCQTEADAASGAKAKIVVGCAAAVALAGWLATTARPPRSLVLLATILVVGFAYGWRLPATKFRLKRVLIVKNLVPSLSWSATVVLLPAPGAELTLPRALALAYVSMAACAIEIIWDVRDMPGDSAVGIRTLPGRFGATAAEAIVHALAAAMAGLAIVGVYLSVVPSTWLFLLSNSALVAYWVRRYGHRLQRERFLADQLVLLELVLLIGLGVVLRWT